MARKRMGRVGKSGSKGRKGGKGATVVSPFTPPMGKGRSKKRGGRK